MARSRSNFSLRHPILALGRVYARHLPARLGAGIVGALAAGGLTGQRGFRGAPYEGMTSTLEGDLFHVNTGDLIEEFLHLFGTWEPDLQAWLRGRLRPGDVVLDVGANIGAITVPAARLVGPTGSVVAIEAVPNTAARLRKNLQANNLPNVRVVESAVSDHRGELTLYLPTKYNRGATSQVDSGHSEGSYSVPCAPLLDLVTPDELSAARIIKIDVEGAEPEVLASVLPALGTLRDDVEFQIEISPGRMGVNGFTIRDIFAPLEAAGFHAYLLRNDYLPQFYPSNIRSPEPPRRLHHPVQDNCDVVFSRIDAEALFPAQVSP